MNSDKSEMLKMLDILTDEGKEYAERLEAYEYLLEDCDDLVDEMLTRFYSIEGETAQMLLEILAGYKGNSAVFMGLVSYLYRGEDVALYARLIGSYGDERGIEILKAFAREYELDYNEFMEVRNAIEQLGGDFESDKDYSDDPFYRYLKGLDEPESESRKSLFGDMLNSDDEEIDCCCDHDHDNDHHDGCSCHCHSEEK